MEGEQHGLIDNWLRHIRDVRRFHHDEVEKLEGVEQFDSMCEFNVLEQVTNVCNTSIVQEAWRKGTDLTVHGWIYNINNGILHSLQAPRSE